MTATRRIGFMQGRLSPLVDGRIQAFPWAHWTNEFPRAAELGLSLMEWTLDQERLYDNPLMTVEGRSHVADLSARHGVRVASLTADCFMQAPFWKAPGSDRQNLETDFLAVVDACAAAGVSMLVVPLVDNGSIESEDQEERLVSILTGNVDRFRRQGVSLAFESDFPPARLAALMGRLDSGTFGINYDIGNSAALGFDPAAEFAAYASRITNVHVKDRRLGGGTVSLGEGNADFAKVFSLLAAAGYCGNFILQTARAADGDHVGALARYARMTGDWIDRGDA